MKIWIVALVLLGGLLVCTLSAVGQDEPVRDVADEVQLATVSPDRREMAFYDGADIQIWDFVGVVRQQRWVFQGRPVWLRFSPDHQTLVVGLTEKRVEGYTLQGQKRWSLQGDEVPVPVQFSADSHVLALPVSERTALELLDVVSGHVLNTFTSHARLNDFAFSPAEPRLALAWSDRRVEFLSQDGSHRYRELDRPDVPQRLVWSPNGRRLLVGEGGTVRMFNGPDLQPGLSFQTVGWKLTPASWSPSGSHFALSHFRAPTQYGLSLREMPGGESMRFDATTEKVEIDWSPDDHLLAVTTDKVRVYRLVDGDLRYNAPDMNPRHAWFAPEGHRMVVWTWDGSLKVWDF